MSKKKPYVPVDLLPRATPRGLELAPVVVKALLAHSSDDFARPTITGIGLDGEGDRAWLCATDGCRLIRMPIRGVVPSGIRSTVWPEREIVLAEARMIAGEVVGEGAEGAPMMVLPWIETEVKFPPAAQVVPRDGRGTEVQSIEPSYLAEACKHADAFIRTVRGSGHSGVTFGSIGTSDLDPMRLDINVKGVIVAQIVIMPRRDDAARLPETHRADRKVGADAPETTEATVETTEATVAPKAKRKRAAKRRADDETSHYRAEAA